MPCFRIGEHALLLTDASTLLTTWTQRGQGGNQSMRDAAMALPLLVQLAERARSGELSDKHVEDACETFEGEMIPRTFEWVQKSGGKETIVSVATFLRDQSFSDLRLAFRL